MRAGAWSTNRDIAAAQLSWERALQVADALACRHAGSNGDAHRSADADMRQHVAGGSIRTSRHASRSYVILCTQAETKRRLATGMAGMTVEHVLHNRLLDASRLASEYMAFVESIGDPALTIGLSFAGIVAKHQTGETDEVLAMDPSRHRSRRRESRTRRTSSSVRRWRRRWLGEVSADSRRVYPAGAMTSSRQVPSRRQSDALSQSAIIAYKYAGIPRGVFLADESSAARDRISAASSPSDRVTTWRWCCCA